MPARHRSASAGRCRASAFLLLCFGVEVVAFRPVAAGTPAALNGPPADPVPASGNPAIAQPPGPVSGAPGTPSSRSAIDTTSATYQGRSPDRPTSTFSGEWRGLRSDLRDKGVELDLTAAVEAASDVRGGPGVGLTTPGQLVLGTTMDTQRLIGLRGGTIQSSVTYRFGAQLPVTLLQQAQEIYGRGHALRLTELWYQQKLAGEALTIKLGRMPQGDFNNFPCYFMNLTFCGAPAGNLVGSYWFNWPISQWAARASLVSGDFTFLAGADENNPADLRSSFASGMFRGATGVIAHVEERWTPRFGATGLQGRYQLGGWYDTVGATDVLPEMNERAQPYIPLQPLSSAQTVSSAPTGYRPERYGYYLQGLQQITGTGSVDPTTGWKGIRGLTVFFNFTQADRSTATLDNQLSVGLFYAGPFASRPGDHVGAAFGRTSYNSRAAEALLLQDPRAAKPGAENAAEIYYSAVALSWLTLRPDLQYVMNPGGLSHVPAVIVLGVRLVASF